jgi:hypothetical protein
MGPITAWFDAHDTVADDGAAPTIARPGCGQRREHRQLRLRTRAVTVKAGSTIVDQQGRGPAHRRRRWRAFRPGAPGSGGAYCHLQRARSPCSVHPFMRGNVGVTPPTEERDDHERDSSSGTVPGSAAVTRRRRARSLTSPRPPPRNPTRAALARVRDGRIGFTAASTDVAGLFGRHRPDQRLLQTGLRHPHGDLISGHPGQFIRSSR